MEENICPSSEPPPLPYSLRKRWKAIAFFWILFVVDTLGQPLVLYWTLWYLTDLSHNLGTFGFLVYLSALADKDRLRSVLGCDRVSWWYLSL